MKKLYPITPAQNMHYEWIKQYKTQQVAGLSVVVSLKTQLDFDILKKCLLEEMSRYECLKVQFTSPDSNGDIKQYVGKTPKDIPFMDLTDITLEQADEKMQGWAYRTFDGDDIPLCELVMLKLPEGYNGFFIHIDHRLLDACGVMVLANDVMQLYTHYAFGSDYPEELASYVDVLNEDIDKLSNEKRFLKNKDYWSSQFDKYGEPLYSDISGPEVLEASKKKHKNKNLRAADVELKELKVAVKDYLLEAEPSRQLMEFCKERGVTINSLLLLGMRTYLSKVNNGQKDITIDSFIARRSSKAQWTSGGSRTIMFPCRTILEPEYDFIGATKELQKKLGDIYYHSVYDPALIYKEMQERYDLPDNTRYESCYLTYQPMMATFSNAHLEKLPQHSKWFANGAATKKVYLTVNHTEDGQMNFSFHYQTASLTEQDMELFYYYLMRILFMGINEPELTLGEIMESA